MQIPVSIDDPANWHGNEIKTGHGWLYTLTEEQRNDLLAMAQELTTFINGDANRLLEVKKEQLNTGSAAALLIDIQKSIKSGPGLALIRGLDPAEIPALQIATIYWCIGLHLGSARQNNPQGDMLGHVTDLGKTQSDPQSRGYQTREAMDYHCDQCDIVGLLCVRTAQEGGLSKVASSVAMYNTLQQQYPHYANALSAPLYWTKHGEHTRNDQPWYTSPVFNFEAGKISTAFGPKHIFKGHQLPDTPPITELQQQAINAAERIADEQHLSMALQPGDMQFLNNYTTIHTRTGYRDHADPARKRLLWRLWLMQDGLRTRTDYAKQWQNGVTAGQVKPRIVL